MGWVTIYITGKEDFRDDVREKLESSDLNLMPGYNGGSTDPHLFTDLYWIDEKLTLRQVKEAIGSKLVWKYRLKFYGSLEAFLESQNAGKNNMNLNAEEQALLAEMVASVYREAS
jgi:hypothetical protein